MVGMAEETLEQKLKRHEDALSLCIAEIEKLRAENTLLRSAEGAHDVLRRIYLDEAQPSGTRVKAAQAAMNFEKPRLESVPPPMDLVPEPPSEPLADVVSRQRARCDRMLADDPQFLALRSHQVIELKPNGGNGSDGDDTASRVVVRLECNGQHSPTALVLN
jgi:hypothetical protein